MPMDFLTLVASVIPSLCGSLSTQYAAFFLHMTGQVKCTFDSSVVLATLVLGELVTANGTMSVTGLNGVTGAQQNCLRGRGSEGDARPNAQGRAQEGLPVKSQRNIGRLTSHISIEHCPIGTPLAPS
jgi:hypothetical protein